MVRPKLKTPISYYGGKQQMLPHILPLIPEHRIYTEAFAGGLAVYWAKDPAAVEVINDIDGEIVNFYYQLKTNFDVLEQQIQSTLHSRQSYEDAVVIYNRPHLFSAVRRAWAFWILTAEGFASKIGSWGYDRDGTTTKKVINKKKQFLEVLANRLETTQIECNDANKVIFSRDTPDTFHLVDPPYINSNQGHYSGYAESHFRSTLEVLAQCNGKFMLCSYPSELLKQFRKEHGWTSFHFDKQLAAGKSGRNRKTEVITLNYDPGIAG